MIAGMSEKRWIRMLLFSYIVLVVLVSAIPLKSLNLPPLNKNHVLGLRLDLLLHGLVFLPLMPLCVLSLPRLNLWSLFVFSLGLAWLAEFIHYILPYRSFDSPDMVANVAGVLVGGVFVLAWRTFSTSAS